MILEARSRKAPEPFGEWEQVKNEDNHNDLYATLRSMLESYYIDSIEVAFTFNKQRVQFREKK